MGNKEYKLTVFKVNRFLGSQGSILGLLLLNIYLADLSLIMDDRDISNYADNNTTIPCLNGLGRFYLNLMPINVTY